MHFVKILSLALVGAVAYEWGKEKQREESFKEGRIERIDNELYELKEKLSLKAPVA